MLGWDTAGKGRLVDTWLAYQHFINVKWPDKPRSGTLSFKTKQLQIDLESTDKLRRRIVKGRENWASQTVGYSWKGIISVLPRPFLQGGTPCPFQEAEMTPCRLLVTPRDALLYFTWPRTSQSAVIGAETMRFAYFGIRHHNPTHI